MALMFGISRGCGRIGIVLFSSQFCSYITFYKTVYTSVLLSCGMKSFIYSPNLCSLKSFFS